MFKLYGTSHISCFHTGVEMVKMKRMKIFHFNSPWSNDYFNNVNSGTEFCYHRHNDVKKDTCKESKKVPGGQPLNVYYLLVY